MTNIVNINSITQANKLFGLDKPKHPLVMVFHHKDIKQNRELTNKTVAIDLYHIMYKDCKSGTFQYGRNTYDFQEGTMVFTAPGQVITIPEWEHDNETTGWSILFHPDLIRRSQLGKQINEYSFFDYSVNEALHLSDDEKQIIAQLRDKVEREYIQNIDKHSQKLIIANIELILDYCIRFYDRQFYTRTNLNKDIVTRFENLLKTYYSEDKHLNKGIPSVKYCGNELNISPNYLSDLLKKETGRNTQDHIHLFIIERAKTQLLNSEESISQIAYGLGFGYPQHFSKLFKKKVGISPVEYRTLN